MMTELLLEIFSEEIPALMQEAAEKNYKIIFAKIFAENQIFLKDENIEVYSGPRRITIHVKEMAVNLNIKSEEIKGPKISAPSSAIDGFCKSNHISLSDLSVIIIRDAEYYAYVKPEKQVAAKDLLMNILPKAIKQHIWPKSMYWGEYDIEWVRPIRNILCIFDGEILPIKYGHIEANNYTFGHRISGNNPIIVTSFEDYKKKLQETYVILDRNERINIIQKGIKELSDRFNLSVVLGPTWLIEVAGLVEYPVVMNGNINEKFLNLPDEILVSTMWMHQKYFPTYYVHKEKNKTELAPFFIFVSNVPNIPETNIIKGNEKVLIARLNDSLYLYEQDKLFYQNDYPNFTNSFKKLELVNFHSKLGSMKQKIDRLVAICEYLEPNNEKLYRASLLSKIDLTSEIVKEFPEIQGLMTAHYLEILGEDEDIIKIIQNNYVDNTYVAPGDLKMHDYMDNLVGLMMAGERATGSADPFALRRSAIAIIKNILHQNISNASKYNLKPLIGFCTKQFQTEFPDLPDKNIEILSFIEERAKFYFKDDYSHEIINGCLDLQKEDNLIFTQNKMQMLQKFLQTKISESLISSYKRVANITEKQNIKFEIDEKLFVDNHEVLLYKQAMNIDKNIDEYIKKRRYDEAFQGLANIQKPLNDLFDNVMINDPNSEIAHNRLMLCVLIKSLFQKIANFDYL